MIRLYFKHTSGARKHYHSLRYSTGLVLTTLKRYHVFESVSIFSGWLRLIRVRCQCALYLFLWRDDHATISTRRSLRSASSHYKVKCVCRGKKRCQSPTLMVPQCQRPTAGPAFLPSAPPFTRPRASSLPSSIDACPHCLPPWRRSRACACAVAPSSDTALHCCPSSAAPFSSSCNLSRALQHKQEHVPFRLFRTSAPLRDIFSSFHAF